MISFAHTYKIFANGYHGLRNVSFDIQQGELVFLTGPSGAGKTTLFKLISAFDRPTSGRVCVLDRDVAEIAERELPYYRRQIGVVYQDFRLLRDRTVFDNVAVPLIVRGDIQSEVDRRVRDVVARVGLEAKLRSLPEELSGGEQQRVAVARALIHEPGVLIADEPTGNLDSAMSGEIFALFESVNAAGTTVFIATHDTDLIRRKPYRVLKIDSGEVRA